MPKGWEIRSFLDCVSIPSKIVGLKRTEYKSTGKFPIFDQAKDYISGYTDSKEVVQEKIPAILFGDHTRVLKIIESPFALGADGTKIFYANKDIDPNFLYQQLLRLDVPNTGYNRHFKWLKDSELVIPPVREQQNIAEILSAIDTEIERSDRVIKRYDDLKIGILADFLKSKKEKTKFKREKLEDLCNFTTGKLNSNKAVDGGEYPFFTCSKETYAIDQYSFDCEAILLAGNNAAGIYSVKHYKGKFDAYQRTYVITVKNEEELDYVFLKEILNAKLNLLKNMSLGSTTKFLTIKLLYNIEVNIPSITEQKRIAKILLLIDQNIRGYKVLKREFMKLKKGLTADLLSGKVRTITEKI